MNDQLEESEKIFCNTANDPFHAFGYALLMYIKAMLSITESQPIDEASTAFEAAIRQLAQPNVHCDLLTAHSILMLSSLQFLKNSWVDHLKAAYELRRAYRIYEKLFEDRLGTSVLEYNLLSSDDHDTIEHGVYFGLGLFYLVLSFLPTKG